MHCDQACIFMRCLRNSLFLGNFGSAQQGCQACCQFYRFKWLGQVVICPGFERFQLVL
jgi:hypothetical protein